MSAHLARARLLLAQSRPADAEREVLQALAAQPEDPQAHALLAISRVEQRKSVEARASAEAAIGFAPDDPYTHFVHALVLHRLERDDEASAAVAEAIRLDPHDADNFSLCASIELSRRNWPSALESAGQALAINPEHVNAANLRAMALVRLGRKEEAMQTVDFALERAPENAFSHANQGWNCLHRNDPRKAQEHFREALRLEPDLEYARQGMLEALKARNPIYRGMLAYFLWMGRLSGKLQFAFIAGVWFGGRAVRALSQAQPQLNWLWYSVLTLFYVFIYLSWTANPMFNLLLRLDRFGRHVLSRDQRIASNWFGAALAGTLGCLAWWLTGAGDAGFLAMILLAVLSVCIAATFNRTGRTRITLAIITGALAVMAIAAMALFAVGNDALGGQVAMLFSFGFIGLQLTANVMQR